MSIKCLVDKWGKNISLPLRYVWNKFILQISKTRGWYQGNLGDGIKYVKTEDGWQWQKNTRTVANDNRGQYPVKPGDDSQRNQGRKQVKSGTEAIETLERNQMVTSKTLIR